MITVDVKTSAFVLTNDFINIKADAIVKLQIPQDNEFLAKAERNLLNRNLEWIAGSVKNLIKNASLPVTECLLKLKINTTLSEGTLKYPKKENKKVLAVPLILAKL